LGLFLFFVFSLRVREGDGAHLFWVAAWVALAQARCTSSSPLTRPHEQVKEAAAA
jgi:hypothetical protein